MSPTEVALRFIERFAAGDLEALEPLLAPALRFRGPLLEVDSREAYLSALRVDPPGAAQHRIVSVTANEEGEVAVFWDYEKAEGRVFIAQLFIVTEGVIQATRLVFAP